jgi:hypothetical protein
MRRRLLTCMAVALVLLTVQLLATTYVSDTFTDASTTALASHTGGTGATWAKNTGVTGDIVISSSNAARMNSTGDVADYYASGSPASADYSVTADFVCKTPPGGSSYFWLTGRSTTSGQNYYSVTYDGDLSTWFLTAPSAGNIASYAQVISSGVTYSVRLEMIGTAIAMYIDGVNRGSATNSELSSTGKGGFGSYTVITNFDTEGIHWDNFTVTDTSSGTTSNGLLLRGVSLLLWPPWHA